MRDDSPRKENMGTIVAQANLLYLKNPYNNRYILQDPTKVLSVFDSNFYRIISKMKR